MDKVAVEYLQNALEELRKKRMKLDDFIRNLEVSLEHASAYLESLEKSGARDRGRVRGTQQWTPAEREAVSRRMKAYWAKRRKMATEAFGTDEPKLTSV